MNNNYHTQLDKKNILHNIALNDQLLQNSQNDINFNYPNIESLNDNYAQSQSYNKKMDTSNYIQQPVQYSNNNKMQLPIDLDKQITDQLSQKENNQTYTQNLFPNQNNNLNTTQNKLQSVYTQNETQNQDKAKEMTNTPTQQHINNEEIELTDGELIQNNIPNVCTKKNGVISCGISPKASLKKVSNNDNNVDYKHIIYEYIVLPLTLVIVFAILTHPRSSLLLERYLPKMDSLKGVLIRGLLMYVAYIVVKLVLKNIRILQKIEK